MTDSDRSDLECKYCGASETTFYTGETAYACAECDAYLEHVDVVPIDVLEDLIETWQLRYDDEITMLEKAAYGTAIRELTEVIEDYSHE